MQGALLLCVAAALFVGAYANIPGCVDRDYIHCLDDDHWYQFHGGCAIPCPKPHGPPRFHDCHKHDFDDYPRKDFYACFHDGDFCWDDDHDQGYYFHGGLLHPCHDFDGEWLHFSGGWFGFYGRGDEYYYHGHPGVPVCFPAEATAQLESGESVTMENLNIGDRVLVNKPDGSLAFEDVYLFGHRDAQGASPYLTLSLEGSDAALTLSGMHYLPVGADRRMTRAEDVTVGQTVWATAAGELAAFRVSEIASSLKRGAFNPFTMGGTIVVNGVAASTHSDWFLDAVTPKALQSYLPAIYQATLAPARLAYNILGAETSKEMDAKFDFAAAGAKGGVLPYASTLAKVVAAAATSSNKA